MGRVPVTEQVVRTARYVNGNVRRVEIWALQYFADVTIGSPFVKGAKVRAEIVRQGKAKKINAFNYKPKKNVRKRWGHRQPQTHLKVLEVIGGK